MKFSFAILILLALPLSAEAHAEIFFPKIFSLSELSNTGFVLLNADPTIATVNFYLLAANGIVLTSPPSIQIPPGGQLARLGSELFPNAPFLDGAEAAQLDTIGPDQIVPLVAEGTELNASV